MPENKRGRKPNASSSADIALPQAPTIDSVTDQARRALAIQQQFGLADYDRARVIGEMRFYMAQSAEAMLQAGARLIQIKENEPHGAFIDIVESQLGIEERTAQKMMQAAVKFMNPAIANPNALSGLGKTKLFELMTLDDDQLVELTEGGTVAGLKLEEIDRMSTRELKQALREAREEATAKDAVISDKDAKINELDTKLRRWKPKKDATLRTLEENNQMAALTEAAREFDRCLVSLFTITEELEADGSEAVQGQASATVNYVFDRMLHLLGDSRAMGMLEERVPDWVAENRKFLDEALAQHAQYGGETSAAQVSAASRNA